jgi:hypothetical protein
MAVDSPSDAPDADPEEVGVNEAWHADHPGGRTMLAESRDRSEYYDALEASRYHDHDTAGDDIRPRSGWDTAEVAEHVDRPSPDSILVNAERTAHILDGDRWGGGHRHGTGRPGKTEFLAGWDDKKVIGLVLDVARVPDGTPVLQPNQRWRVHGDREGVTIYVIVQPDGRIWSAWPDEGSPGVIRNPKEGRR